MMIGDFHHNLCVFMEHKISRSINFMICAKDCAWVLYQLRTYRDLCDMEDLHHDPNELFPKCIRAYMPSFVRIEERYRKPTC